MKKNKQKKTIWMIVISVCIFVFISCTCISIPVYQMLNAAFGSPPDLDVTDSPGYKFSAMAGTRWKTKTEVAFAELRNGTKYLLPPQSFDPTHPSYDRFPNSRVLAVLPAGTHLRIEKLMKGQGNRSAVRVMATLDASAYPQKKVYLDIYFFERNSFFEGGRSLPNIWSVNPDLLESAK